jgi:hypothetical protein
VVVPAQLAFISQHGEGRGGEGLGIGGDGEEGVLIHGLPLAGFEAAVALAQQHIVAPHDGDGQAGHAPVGPGLGDVGVQAGQSVARRGLGLQAADGGQRDGEEEEMDQSHVRYVLAGKIGVFGD